MPIEGWSGVARFMVDWSGVARFMVEPTHLDFPLFIIERTARDERSAQGQHIGEGKEKAYYTYHIFLR